MFSSNPRAWRLAHLDESPHRLCFVAGALVWVLSSLWWAAVLLGATAPDGLSAISVHALCFSLGAMPLFVVGFMATAGPRWLRVATLPTRELRPGVLACVAGWVLFLTGAYVATPWAGGGLAFVALGLAALTARLGRMVCLGEPGRRSHLAAMTLALTVVVACLSGVALATGLGAPVAIGALSRVGLWWGLGIVFVVVSHRMLPFFGDGAFPRLERRWPQAALMLVLTAPIAQGAAAGVGLLTPAAPMRREVLALILALALVTSLRLSARWFGSSATRQPLLRMLFIGLGWWNLSLAFGAASGWPGLSDDGIARLDRAALHAFALGYLGSTTLAMITRVAAARSGRSVSIDGFARRLFAGVQVAATGRVAVALWPVIDGAVLSVAAAVWCAVAIGWSWRAGPWLATLDARESPLAFVRPRDSRPGGDVPPG